MAALCTFGAFGLNEPELKPLLYQTMHLGNYSQPFEHQAGMPGTGILWSLAVEEHVYLVWPILFVSLYGRVSRVRFSVLLASICTQGSRGDVHWFGCGLRMNGEPIWQLIPGLIPSFSVVFWHFGEIQTSTNSGHIEFG